MGVTRLVLLGLLVLGAGCAPLELSKDTLPNPWKPKPQIAENLVDFWGEYLHHSEGESTIRGFGGRMMFYGTKPGEAVLVDGTVTIYAYDDSKGPRDDKNPDKKFIFTQDQLAKHYSKSSLGPSYSFWLPWDEAGGPQKKITLIARFDDASGKVVMGKPSKMSLFGSDPAAALASKKTPEKSGEKEAEKAGEATTGTQTARQATVDPAVRQASYEAAPLGLTPAGPEVRTTTITLPPRLSRRFNATEEASPTTAATAAPDSAAAESSKPDSPKADSSAKTSAAAAPAGQSPGRSEPGRPLALRERAIPPTFGRGRTRPYLATSPSSPPSIARTDSSTGSTATPPDAPADPN